VVELAGLQFVLFHREARCGFLLRNNQCLDPPLDFVLCGEWLCVLSVILFCCAALDSLRYRQPRRDRQ
jgi:hypothetical protein